MKQIVCEMCGGKELIKQDGVFTCQSCGTKYSIEEAKKMMVTIDTSAKLENALKNARRAMENKDYEKARECYNIVQMEDPENWEANFYSAYCKKSLNRSSIKNVLKDVKKLEDNALQNKAIEQISKELEDNALQQDILGVLTLVGTDKIERSLENGSAILEGEENLGVFVEELFLEFGKNEFTTSIKIRCDKALLKVRIKHYEILLKIQNNVITTLIKEDKAFNWDSAEKYADELAKINPTSYELTRFNENKRLAKKKWIPCGILVFIILLCIIGMVVSAS